MAVFGQGRHGSAVNSKARQQDAIQSASLHTSSSASQRPLLAIFGMLAFFVALRYARARHRHNRRFCLSIRMSVCLPHDGDDASN